MKSLGLFAMIPRELSSLVYMMVLLAIRLL